MKTKPLTIGIAIYDMDLKNVTDNNIENLKKKLYKNRIIVIKDQQLTEEEYCDFAMKFGEPVPYLQQNYNHPDYPLIFVSSNVKQEGKKIGVARTGGYWHSDTAFEQDPKPITMLMPKILPKKIKRTTKFIDMSLVYQSVPEHIRKTIETAFFYQSGRYRYKVRPDDVGMDITEILEMIDYHQPPAIHPAVITHPHTNEKIIYASKGFTIGIKDVSKDKSEETLEEIFDLAESDQFVKEVTWEKGDVIIWDNRFLCHSSGRKKALSENIHKEIKKEEETMMYRITLKDGYPLSS